MEWMNWLFFGPAKLIANLPYGGLAICVLLVGAQAAKTSFAKNRFDKQWLRKAPVFTGLLWAIFNLYEWQLAAVLGAAGNAGAGSPVLLRLDLIVLTPLLIVLSAFAVFSLISAEPKSGQNEAGRPDESH